MKTSGDRQTATFGVAVAVSHAGQFVWISAGARELGIRSFGIVLACQALYGVMQIVVDNGTAMHGARQSAGSTLTGAERDGIVVARLMMAVIGLVVSVGAVALAAPDFLRPLLPYAIALLPFALLNVWEPYGRGAVRAFATYLSLRSLVLAGTVTVCALTPLTFSVEMAGSSELVAILVTGCLFRAWSIPTALGLPPAAVWRSIRDVGLPSFITQVTLASSTVILAMAGNPRAAAVAGVGARLLTGLQGVSGVVGAGLFPRFASGQSKADGRAARIAPVGIVGTCLLALAVTCLAKSTLVRVMLDQNSDGLGDAIVLWVGGAAASGYVMHLTFTLVARHAERGLVRAGTAGAATAAVSAAVASRYGTDTAALIAGGGFLVGQAATLLLVARHVRNAGLEEWLSPKLTVAACAGCAIAVMAIFSSILAAAAALAVTGWCAHSIWALTRPPSPERITAQGVRSPAVEHAATARDKHRGDRMTRCWACGEHTAEHFDEHGYVSCAQCGLRFFPSGEAPRCAYDAHYFHAYKGGDYLGTELRRRHESRERLRLLPRPQPGADRLLEIGSAAGFFLDEATAAGWIATGVEASSEIAAIAADAFGVDIRVGFVEDLNLSDISADVVCAWHTLEHIPEPASVLRAARERLGDCGTFAVEVPNAASLMARRRGQRWSPLEPDVHVAQWTPEALRFALMNAGFTQVAITSVPFLVYVPGRTSRSLRRVLLALRQRRWISDRSTSHELLRAVARVGPG